MSRERHGNMSMTANVTTDGPGVFKLLVWSAARKPVSWQTAARGPAGAQLLGFESGDSSFIARSREFDAPVNGRLTRTRAVGPSWRASTRSRCGIPSPPPFFLPKAARSPEVGRGHRPTSCRS